MTTLTDSYQELLRFAIAERDAFYEGATDPEGNLTDPEDQAELDRMDAMIDRAQAVKVQPGWITIPAHPTPKMLDAGTDYMNQAPGLITKNAHSFFSAMLAAAPSGDAKKEWPETNDIMTRYLQEKAQAAGMSPDEMTDKLAVFAGLVISDATGGSGDAKREAETCPECESTDLTWQCVQWVKNDIPDGRLRLTDVASLFVLACNNCSESVRVEDCDDIAARLRQSSDGDDSDGVEA